MTRHVVQAFCEENLLNIKLRGETLYATCPCCGKEHNHWNINLDNGLWYCYRCGASGNFKQLVKLVTGRYINDQRLEEEYVSELTLETLQEIFSEADESSELTEFGDWKNGTCDISVKGRLPSQARDYLRGRGVSLDLAKDLQFRVAISGRYTGRIIMPVIEDEIVKNFVARAFTGNMKRYDGPHKWESYVNKSELLWNWDNIKYGSDIVLVEGIFDAIPLLDLDVLALMGKSISPIQVSKLLDKAESVIVLLDKDFCLDSEKIAKNFLGLIPVKIAFLDEGDPSEFPELARIAIKGAKDFFCC